MDEQKNYERFVQLLGQSEVEESNDTAVNLIQSALLKLARSENLARLLEDVSEKEDGGEAYAVLIFIPQSGDCVISMLDLNALPDVLKDLSSHLSSSEEEVKETVRLGASLVEAGRNVVLACDHGHVTSLPILHHGGLAELVQTIE